MRPGTNWPTDRYRSAARGLGTFALDDSIKTTVVSNNHSIALIFCLSKAFESVLNKKIMMHPSAHNLLSDCQYGFRTESWSSSFRDFGENFADGLDISKAFNRVLLESLMSKLPSYGFYPFICTFFSNFLSDSSIAAVVDGHCSSPKTINSGSVLSSTLFLLFINDLLNLTQCDLSTPMLMTPPFIFQRRTTDAQPNMN